MKKIIFTGGGTGGHIMPNLAIIEQLKDKNNCKYIGSKNSMEENIMSPILPFFSITTCKLKRSLSLSNLLIPFKLIKGIAEAKRILKKEHPNLVFSKGGFVAVPVVIASKMLKIPVIAHESDYTLGLANKLTKKYANVICTSFEDTSKKLKNGIYTGSPIRKCIFNGNKTAIFNRYYIKHNLPNLLVVGGSLGSKNINEIVYKNAKKLSVKFNIFHIAGKNCDYKTDIKNYHIIDYTNKIEDYMTACDFAITRGGSNIIFELLALKKPMIIIPLSKGSRGDQIDNANIFTSKGYSLKLLEEALQDNDNLLLEKLEELLKNKDTIIKNMDSTSINGTKKIIEQIEKYL